MTTSSKPRFTAEPEEIQETPRETWAKFTRFRILVIGRANAGKTTILRTLCNATGEPMIFSPDGKKIEPSALYPSVKRGGHDIENQMVFESNPGFIFHDSPGFEAGSARELNLVQKFIEKRSKAANVNEQLHAIWYCIPTSDDRPITAAEKKFFNECGTGLVPVILLWTKTDSLDLAKIKQLVKEGNSRSDALKQAPQKAWTDYEMNIRKHLNEFKYPPKAYVVFRNMDKPGADCKDLIEKTTTALSTEDLKQLFLSTQQNHVELCIVYGIKRIVNSTESILLKYFKQNDGDWACFMAIVLRYFPQIDIEFEEEFKLLAVEFQEDSRESFFKLFEWGFEEGLKRRKTQAIRSRRVQRASEENERNELLELKEEWEMQTREHHNKDSISEVMSNILSGLSTKFNLKEATYCAIVAAIVGHLSFFISQRSSNTNNSLERAAQIYQQSGCETSVQQAVNDLFKDSDIDHDMLVKGATQIALNNILSSGASQNNSNHHMIHKLQLGPHQLLSNPIQCNTHPM